MPAPERRRGNDDSVTAPTHAHASHKAPTQRFATEAWESGLPGHPCERGAAPGANLDGSRPLGAARLFQTGGGDMSANKEAINASGALNRPRRSSGGTTASTASSFSEGSIRR